jgi:hypothetical protein
MESVAVVLGTRYAISVWHMCKGMLNAAVLFLGHDSTRQIVTSRGVIHFVARIKGRLGALARAGAFTLRILTPPLRIWPTPSIRRSQLVRSRPPTSTVSRVSNTRRTTV